MIIPKALQRRFITGKDQARQSAIILGRRKRHVKQIILGAEEEFPRTNRGTKSLGIGIALAAKQNAIGDVKESDIRVKVIHDRANRRSATDEAFVTDRELIARKHIRIREDRNKVPGIASAGTLDVPIKDGAGNRQINLVPAHGFVFVHLFSPPFWAVALASARAFMTEAIYSFGS